MNYEKEIYELKERVKFLEEFLEGRIRMAAAEQEEFERKLGILEGALKDE